MAKTKPATNSKRLKHTTYTDNDPDVEDMIQSAYAQGRVFTFYSVTALREWFARNGFKSSKKPAGPPA